MTRKLMLGMLLLILLGVGAVTTLADGSPIPPIPPHAAIGVHH